MIDTYDCCRHCFREDPHIHVISCPWCPIEQEPEVVRHVSDGEVASSGE